MHLVAAGLALRLFVYRTGFHTSIAAWLLRSMSLFEGWDQRFICLATLCDDVLAADPSVW